MTHADRRLVLRLGLAVIGSLSLLILAGVLVDWLRPPSEVERACVNKPLSELGWCLYEEEGKKAK